MSRRLLAFILDSILAGDDAREETPPTAELPSARIGGNAAAVTTVIVKSRPGRHWHASRTSD